MSEQWRVCPGYPDYEVSDAGNVRRLTPGINTYVGRPIAGFHDKDGYRRVLLRLNGRRKILGVHRMVVAAFTGPIPDDMQINHKNGIKNDNRSANLEIVTPAENTRHGPVARLIASEVREIRKRHALGETQTDLARQFGINRTNVTMIISHRRWRNA